MIKRLILILVLVLAIIGIPFVSEAREKDVTVESADITTTEAAISGTTEAPAVMVQIRNSDGEIVSMVSFAVVDNEFSGNITQSFAEGETYRFFVADYEGGDFTIVEVTAAEESESETPASTDNTSASESSETTDASENSTSSDTSSQETSVAPLIPPATETVIVPVTPTGPVAPPSTQPPAGVRPEKPDDVTDEKEETESQETEKPGTDDKPAADEETIEETEVQAESEAPFPTVDFGDRGDADDDEADKGSSAVPIAIGAAAMILILVAAAIFFALKRRKE